MLDLETLGPRPGSVILSIGAVAFGSTELTGTFEVNIDPRSCQRSGLTIDGDTVLWWFRQSDVARAAVQLDPEPLSVALDRFTRWMEDKQPCRLWSKGPSFDAAILAIAYRSQGLAVPWEYWNERCVRTVLDLAGIDVATYRETDDTRHRALTDAMVQARAVQEALRRLQRS